MRQPKQKLLFSILFLPLIGVSCLSPSSGGVWISPDGGQTWEQRNAIVFQGTTGSLASSDILDLAQSVSAPEILFAATDNRGIYKTEDGAETWFPVTTSGRVQAVDISALNHEDVAAARDDQIFLSRDGGEEWRLVYTNPSPAIISDISFDSNRDGVLYASLTTGDLLRSGNFGTTWQKVSTFDQPIVKIVTTPRAQTYLLTTTQVHQSSDGGQTWIQLESPIKTPLYVYRTTVLLLDLIAHPQDPRSLLASTKDGLYLSENAGESWRQLPLLTQGEENQLFAIAWDPQAKNRIYYASRYVFYKSENTGQSWQTIPFPQALVPNTITIHPNSPEQLFLGGISL